MADSPVPPPPPPPAGGNPPPPPGGAQPPAGGMPPPPPGGGNPPPPPPPPQQQGGAAPVGQQGYQQGAQPPAGSMPPPPPPPPPAQSGAAAQPPAQQPPAGYAPPAQQPVQQAPAQPVVRPGDPVPDGGLDPTQVFASPPPPPPSQDDGTAPPQDSGPPPPPPGQQLTDEQLKQMGYDDEDIRILKEVRDYRFGSISGQLSNERIALPGHPETQFDEQVFLTLLRGSISLTRDEKWRILQAIPKLSQFQIDELQKILEEEKRKFSELSPKHLLQLQKLEQKHSDDWRDLQQVTVQQDARQHEQSQADDIRKQLGLS